MTMKKHHHPLGPAERETLRAYFREKGQPVPAELEDGGGDVLAGDRCELCGDVDGRLFLQARCHPSAPLRAVKEGNVLILRCYLPECDREVVRLRLADAPCS